MDTVPQGQIMEEVAYISNTVHTLEKGKNLTILLPAMIKS